MVLWPGLMDRQYQLTGQLVVILLAYTSLARGILFFIIPSTSNPCSQQPCLTLSQLADNSTVILQNCSNVTLLFLSGNHSLDREILFADVDSVSLSKFIETVHVTCRIQSGMFKIHRISNVTIKGLNFIGCGGNRVTQVTQFKVQDTTFLGMEGSGTALTLNGIEAFFFRCYFFSNTNHRNAAFQKGGAVFAHNSSLLVADSTFTGNAANIGGVMSMVGGSLHITNSTFSDNHVDGMGGVIYSNEGSVHITSTTFNRNAAEGFLSSDEVIYLDGGSAVGSGGVLYSLRASFHAASCTFSDNTAVGGDGGVFYSVMGSFHADNCTFSDNSAAVGSGGVVYSLGGALFHTANSTFRGNTAGHNGGVIHSYGGSLYVADSTFTGNVADVGGVMNMVSASLHISSSIFISTLAIRAAGVIFSERSSLIRIADSKFSNNTAAVGGAGVIYSHGGSVHTANSTFTDNTAADGDGGVINIEGGSFQVASSAFSNNTARGGNGGVIYIRESSCIVNTSVFYLINNHANYGGAIFGVDSTFTVSGDVTIANNTATHIGGGVYLQYSNFEMTGERVTCYISNNSALWGGGIYARGSLITVNQPSALHFTGNNAQEGGGIYIGEGTRLHMLKHRPESRNDYAELILSFAENHAQLGGAVYANDNSDPCMIEFECFLQVKRIYYREIITAVDANMMNIFFSDNSATKSGDSIYGGSLNKCVPSQSAEVHRNRFAGYGVEYLGIISNITLDSISSLPVQVCFCNDQGQSDCHHQPKAKHIKKGATFNMSLAALDQIGHPLEATISSTPSNGHFDEGQRIQNVRQGCTDLMFNLYSSEMNLSLTPYAVGSPCRNSSTKISIQFVECTCPVGFEPSSERPTSCICVCDSALAPHITECVNGSLMRRGTNSWIDYINGTYPHQYLIYVHCPFDYCYPPTDNVTINLNNPNGADAQCAHRRAGMLCGGCQQNLSLSLGSSRCLPCGSYWPAKFFGILLAAIIAGILLVAVLMLLNLTVATGLINSFTFYANIVAAGNSVLFPSSEPHFPTVFVAWLNLDVGFDVCFIDGLDAYTKTWLQLAFPAYIIALVILVIIISEHSPRFTRLLGRRDPVATLATLILLSYAKLLSTTIGVLSFAILRYPDGPHVVWLPDGHVKYLQGKHTALIIVAILIILLGVPYTVLLFLWQWCIQTPNWKIFGWTRNTRLNGFIATYHAPYNIKHRYWTGLLLLVRVVLYITAAVTVSSDPEVPLLMTIVLVAGLIFLKGIIGIRVYKVSLVDIVETLIYLNLLVFAAISLYHFNSDNTKQTTIAYMSTTMTFVLLVGVVLTHEILIVKKKWYKPSVVKEYIAPVQPAKRGAEHAKVTYSYVEFSHLQPELECNMQDCMIDYS